MLKKSKLNNSHGFSLVEVIIVAGIMAGISYFAMELLDGQRRAQKDVENRFELVEMISEMTSILRNNSNCLETFKGQDIKKILKNQQQLNIAGIKKVRSDNVVLTHDFTHDPSKGKSWKRPVAVSLQLRDYEETNKDLDQLNQWDGSLLLSYQWDKKSKRKVTKSINLSFTFDNEGKLSSCQGESGSTGTMAIADPTADTSLVGLNGHQACQSLGRSCVAINSQNFASRVYGQEGLDNLCQSNYGLSHFGVNTGVNKSNWHKCEVQLGIYDTYAIKRSGLELQCQAIFTAICQ